MMVGSMVDGKVWRWVDKMVAKKAGHSAALLVAMMVVQMDDLLVGWMVLLMAWRLD